MVDMNWELLGNGVSTSSTRYHGSEFDNDPQSSVSDTYDNYMGQFTKEWLYDKRNDYSPDVGSPGPTYEPTAEPTDAPTDAPTDEPTDEPTAAPTETPDGTAAPTDAPTVKAES